MNENLEKRRFSNFQHNNYKFLRPTPRTFREAFGAEMYAENNRWNKAVFWVVLVCACVGALIVGVK